MINCTKLRQHCLFIQSSTLSAVGATIYIIYINHSDLYHFLTGHITTNMSPEPLTPVIEVNLRVGNLVRWPTDYTKWYHGGGTSLGVAERSSQPERTAGEMVRGA